MIGNDTRILYNVRIDSNVIIGVAFTITKYFQSSSVAGGIPCKVIGKI